MTLSLILNIVFAAFVLTVIPGMLALAIRTSRNDQPPRTRPVRRPVAHPSRSRAGFSRAYSGREPA